MSGRKQALAGRIPHRLGGLFCGELDERKAHGGVGVAADSAVDHLTAALEEHRQLLLCDLQCTHAIWPPLEKRCQELDSSVLTLSDFVSLDLISGGVASA